jgi:pyruvate-formate lyase-activating enzyme
MNNQKVFPIKQGVACQLKWTWNTLRIQEATSACCHRVDPINLTPDNFANFHNHPTWIKHREMQLEGFFPQNGCQYCEKIEQTGGVSDRILHLEERGIYPPELDSTPLATHVTPRVLEIFINNRCNLSCIYCDESNSTRILKENKKFGYGVKGIDSSIRIIPKVQLTNQYDELLGKFFEYLETNYQYLRKINVLGGEPFYQKEFFKLVDFLISRKNPDLNFTVITNLMVSRSVLEEFVEKMKKALVDRKLKRLDITASIDCFGSEQEYVRNGIELNQWRENFEFLARHKWIYMTINNTITSLTIRTLPDLLLYINDLRKQRRINHSFGLVDNRHHLHPRIFGPGYFHDDLNKVISLMDTSGEWSKKSVEYMKGVQNYLDQSQEDITLQNYLRLYLDEIDRRRGTNWKNIFPWLVDHFTKDIDVV